MAYTYEQIASFIPNTTMRERLLNGEFRTLLVKPDDGYVMHDTAYDIPNVDSETNEPTGEITLGYRPTEASVARNDASLIRDEDGNVIGMQTIQMLDEAGNMVTAYGTRQFFTKPVGDVRADQIFGVTNPPEIM